MASARSRAKRRRGDDDSANRWLGTYGDAVTLLMAFFVMLYAMSQIDQVKFEAFVRGLEVPFGNPAVSEGLLSTGTAIVGQAEAAPQAPGPETISLVDRLPSEVEEEEEGEEVETDPHEEDEAADVAVEDRDLDQLNAVRDAIDSSLVGAGLDNVADYRIDERGLVVSISADDVLFETASTTISDLGREVITAVAEPLGQFTNDVLIEGHTDDVPLTRPGYTNWNLSTDRAVAVLSLLYQEFDLDQDRLGAGGFGEFRPRVPNDSPEHRAMNRRVDILIVAQGVS